jgi:hypothetical protein
MSLPPFGCAVFQQLIVGQLIKLLAFDADSQIPEELYTVDNKSQTKYTKYCVTALKYTNATSPPYTSVSL